MKLSHIIAAAAAPLALGGMLLTTAGAASAVTSPGTTGPGSFQFLTFDPTWNYTDGIQTTGGGAPVTEYQVKVQPPLNAPGQPPSALSSKMRTIPVKYLVESRISTPGSTTVYPDTLQSYADPNIVSTNLYWNAPAGLKVSDIQNLTADFTWAQGFNHGGSMRWQIDTPDGNIMVYYGDTSSSFQSGTQGSGDNMIAQADARFEGQGFAGSPMYDTLAHVLARTAPAGTVADEPVQSIGLVVDGGWGGAQKVTLADVTIGTSAGTSTYTPGTVSTGPSVTAWAADNSQPAYLYLAKVGGSQIAENTLTDTQGNTGGQFRVVDGMYMYNLPLSQLTDLTAQYKVGISFHTDGSDPAGLVQFGLK